MFFGPRFQAAAAQPAPAEIQASVPVSPLDPSTLPIATPWGSTGTLEKLVYADVFGTEPPQNTRSAAMDIPAVAAARNLLVNTIARLPLVQLRKDEILDPQPPWLQAFAGGTSPQHRMAWTVDDLIFYGWSCWWRTNGKGGYPIAAGRINMGDWSINSDNQVEINGQPVHDDQVIVFSAFNEGVLGYGKKALADIRALHEIVRDRLENPVPQVELHQTSGKALTKTERDDLVQHWRDARKVRGGTVGFTNQLIELKTHGADADAQLMIEARNAAAVDAARLLGVSAGLIDATAPKASLNYETQTGRNQEFVDFALNGYLTPITARLSGDDVCPKGQRIAFDKSDLVVPDPGPTGPTLED